MKTLFIVGLAIVGLLLMPLAGYGQSDQNTSAAPPVAQPLVREGDFAIDLVKALGIGAPQNEADAENMLDSSGIAPQNGWMADYPVTPDVLGDLQKAVAAAADSQRLPMGKEEALNKLRAVTTGLGLPVVADASQSDAENSAPPTTYNGENPDVVNNYYYDNGPPVVTYYPPPGDYNYLYAWVPYPFWFGGFFFTGFFCLHDFHRTILVNHVPRFCTNHLIDPRTNRVAVIDPVRRTVTTSFGARAGFSSVQARRGAGAIFNRSLERTRITNTDHTSAARGFSGVNPAPPRSGEHFQPQIPSQRGSSIPGMGGRSEGVNSMGRGEREFSSPPPSSGRSSSLPPVHENEPSMQFHRGMTDNFSGGHFSGGFHGGGSGHGDSFGIGHGSGIAHSEPFGGSPGASFGSVPGGWVATPWMKCLPATRPGESGSKRGSYDPLFLALSQKKCPLSF